jgi:hypothetical protein
MARYLFQTQYRGATLTDDIGEELPTLHEAEAHATVVANELGRNRTQAVTVFVLSENGELLARSGSNPLPRSTDVSLAELYKGTLSGGFAHLG